MAHINLPSGPISSKDLQWFDKQYYGKTFPAANLPKDRLDDFLKGESGAEGARFSVVNCHQKRKGVKVCLLAPISDQLSSYSQFRKISSPGNCCNGSASKAVYCLTHGEVFPEPTKPTTGILDLYMI